MKKVVITNPNMGALESVRVTMSHAEWNQTEFHKRYYSLVRAEVERRKKEQKEAENKRRKERGLPPLYRRSAAA